MKENLKFMNNAWQLCVVDTDIVDFSNIARINGSERLNDAIKGYGERSNGKIVFVVDTFLKKFSEVSGDSMYRYLIFSSIHSFLGGILFAYAFDPSENKYIVLLNDILRPIITIEDAMQVELKFGIDLKKIH